MKRDPSIKVMLVGIFALVMLQQCLSIRASSNRSTSTNICSELCGDLHIPYPFYINSESCGLPGFGLHCIEKAVKIEVNKIKHNLLSFSAGGITIDPLHGSCYGNLNDFKLMNMKNYAISLDNFVQFSGCTNKTVCPLNCNIPFRKDNQQCNFDHTCCFPLMEKKFWQPGSHDFSAFKKFECRNFISWVLSNSFSSYLDAEYGLRLEWGILDTCQKIQCDPNASCVKTIALRGGVRCICKEDFEGDGFSQGSGCTRVCTKHGTKTYGKDCDHNVTKIAVLAAGIVAAGTLVAAIFIALALFRRRKLNYLQRRGRSDGSQLASLLPMRSQEFNSKLFSYKTLEKATKGFAATEKCGHGACGVVYEGKLQDGRQVAIKRIHFGSTHGVDQLINEISVLSTVKHKNLVQLLGCCLDSEEPILVYEFIPNGTLAEHLHQERGEGLSWIDRINIASDASEALAYLHATLNPPIYHRDVKTCNILLDFEFNCKVSDFGLSRLVLSDASHISTFPQGTPGYLDPEYHQTFHLTDKSDVYSFGVVLIEIITAKKPVDFSREQKDVNLASLALTKITNGRLDEIVDPILQIDKNTSLRPLVQRVAELAFRCLSYDKDARPTMVEVSQELQSIKKASMPLEEEPMKDFPLVTDTNESPDKIVPSPTSVQALWPSNSTTPSDSLT